MHELSHALVTAPDPALPPERWMIFAHGIFGTGANWRTFARRWVAVRPEWGAILVDLREHGRSQGLPPPHTIAAAAADLSTLDAALPQGAIRGIVGHSFGGKVALQYVQTRGGDLDEAWILDSTPGARPDAHGSEETERVFSLLAALPKELPSRQAFNDTLLAAGLSQAIVQWLAMGVVRDDSAPKPLYRYRLDLDAIRSLLDDYFARDLWPVVDDPPGQVTLHFVAGGRSSVFSAADRERVERAAARHPGRVSMDVIPEAGHWLHVDAPDALFKLISRS
jgi:esterase